MRSIRHAVIAVLSMLVFLPSQTALAWGPVGHRIVAAIAWSHLTPAARQQAEAILGNEDFVDVANWADAVRLSRTNTKDWHFVDIPLSETTYDATRDCQALATGDCAIAEIGRAIATLKDRQQPARVRYEALKFVIHFVGDIHQPLHTATNGTRANGDRGGNSVNTRLLTHTMKLHAVWDHGLIETTELDEEEYLAKVETLIQGGSISDNGSVDAWVNESHRLAISTGYKYPGFKVGVIPKTKVLLNQTYVNKAVPVVDRQLARAGLRLAKLLNDALTSQ